MPPKKPQQNQSANNDDVQQWITIDECNRLLAQQRDTFKEMMDRQEKNFKTFLESFMTTTNTRIDDFITKTSVEMADVKHSLEFSQNEIDELKTNSQRADADSRLNTIEDQCDYLENQSRRSNLRIDGIPEMSNESWDQTEESVKTLFTDSLGLQDMEIDRAHRIGTRSNGKKPHRTIVVKMTKYKQKEMVLRAAKEKRLEKIFINEDYSHRVVTKRQALVPKMLEARRAGKIAYISYDKLIVKDKQPR